MEIRNEFLIISPIEIVDDVSKLLDRKISLQIVNKKVKLRTASKIKKGKECVLVVPAQMIVRGGVLGLLKGEMLFSKNCLSSFVFANSNPIAINLVLDLLKNLGIKPEYISTCLEICCQGIRNIENLKENAINFWRKNTGISSQKLRKNIRLRFEFKPDAIYGNLQLRVNNKLLRAILQVITNLGIKIAKKNKAFAIDFVRGLIAAEGNVNINPKTSDIRMVRISAKLKSDREDYKKILKCIGIKIYSKDMESVSKKKAKELGWKSNGRGGAVIVTRFSNFVTLLDIGAFSFCPEKKNKFLSGFVMMKSTKNLLRFKKLPAKFTLGEMRKTFNLSRQPTDTKNNFLKLNFIRWVSGLGKQNDPMIFELTEKAKRILNEINSYSSL
jgi:hypothetical protein